MAQATDQQRKTAKNRSPVQTFAHHIRELRRRLFATVAIGVVIGSIVYYYNDFFVRLVMAPLGDQKLIYLTPVGGFSFIFMIATYVTLLFMLPVVLYQLYAFLKPAIPKHSSRLSIKVALAATFLMAAGATFGYIFAVPGGLHFLSGFASEYVTASLTADAYLKFVLGYVFGLGLLFELPLLLLFWHWIHPLTPKQLLNSERYVIVVAFVAAAILTPTPDALSQTIIAVPIIVIYQIGVVSVLVSIMRSRKQVTKPEVTRQSELKAPIVRREPTVKPVMTVNKPRLQPYPIAASRPTPVVRQNVMHPASAAQSKRPIKPAPHPPRQKRPQLVVPGRPARLISDFRPNRRSSIDTANQNDYAYVRTGK